MEDDNFENFLNKHKISEANREILKKAGITSLEILAGLNENDLTNAGLSNIPAKTYFVLAQKELDSKKNSGGGDHRKGNFGNGGAYAENGNAVGTISGGETTFTRTGDSSRKTKKREQEESSLQEGGGAVAENGIKIGKISGGNVNFTNGGNMTVHGVEFDCKNADGDVSISGDGIVKIKDVEVITIAFDGRVTIKGENISCKGSNGGKVSILDGRVFVDDVAVAKLINFENNLIVQLEKNVLKK